MKSANAVGRCSITTQTLYDVSKRSIHSITNHDWTLLQDVGWVVKASDPNPSVQIS